MAIIPNISRADYVALEGINWSALKVGNGRRGAHIRAALTGGGGRDSQALKFGRALHLLILQPELFEGAFAIVAGKTTSKPDALTEEDMRRLRGMHESWLALNHKVTHCETALTWEFGGVKCKGMIDGLLSAYLFDLKSTQNAEARAFAAEAYRYSYHGQMAWYHEGLVQNGIQPAGVRIVALEKEAPYSSADFFLDDRWLDIGRDLFERLLSLYVDNESPDYGQSRLMVPEWADRSTLELEIGGNVVEL